MLTSSSAIDPRLADAVRAVETGGIGYRAVAGAVFGARATRFCVTYNVAQPRTLSLIEEFALRAGLEISPRPSVEELGRALALDQSILMSVCKSLARLGMLEQSALPLIRATPAGQAAYARGSAPSELQERTREGVLDSFTGTFTFKLPKSGLLSIQACRDLPMLPSVGSSVGAPDLDIIRAALVDLGEEDERTGRVLQSVEAVERADDLVRQVGVIVVADAADSTIYVRCYDIASKRFLPDYDDRVAIESALDALGMTARAAEGEDVGGSEDASGSATAYSAGAMPAPVSKVDEYAEAYAAELASKIREEVRKARATDSKPAPDMDWLTDGDIRPRFIKTIKRARREVVIMSPWINEDVMDSGFLKILQSLADKRVLTLMGWGIDKAYDWPTQKHHQDMLDRVAQIRTPDGVKAVSILWVGNHHNKDLIVDRKFHMCGSHNWLSYRGDRHIRGESVYWVAVPDTVKKAVDYTTMNLLDAAATQWSDYARGRLPDSVRDSCLITWAATDRFDLSFGAIRDLVADHAADHAADHVADHVAGGVGRTRRPGAMGDAVEALRHTAALLNVKKETGCLPDVRTWASMAQEAVVVLRNALDAGFAQTGGAGISARETVDAAAGMIEECLSRAALG